MLRGADIAREINRERPRFRRGNYDQDRNDELRRIADALEHIAKALEDRKA